MGALLMAGAPWLSVRSSSSKMFARMAMRGAPFIGPSRHRRKCARRTRRAIGRMAEGNQP
jgi:hypothetical protein